ncbi:MAG: methyltransferase domain-containing protein [Firmicutes bacterium]|nr:methyltransferase domain-containing protein [Bacillota bacterium]
MSSTYTYMATVVPGLEDVVMSEVTAKLPGAWIQTKLRGRILFTTDCSWAELKRLRCIDNLYLHIAWLTIGPHKAHLVDIVSGIEEIPFHQFPYLCQAKPGDTAIVSASRSGHHTFSRFDAAKAALQGLINAHDFTAGTTKAHDFNFRLDIIDNEGLFSLKLTDATFRFRGMRAFSRAALRPPIAHALVWLSNPQADDVFLDPFCGSGTIPIERANYGALSITGSDISSDAVSAARANAPQTVTIRQMDACNLKAIPSESVTTIVTNLPWGKQITPNLEIDTLYTLFLQEARRVLVPHGRAIMLTDQQEALERAGELAKLRCRPLYTASLHGSLPTVFLLEHGS